MNEHETRYAYDVANDTLYPYRFCGVTVVETFEDDAPTNDEDLMTDGELYDRYGYGYP